MIWIKREAPEIVRTNGRHHLLADSHRERRASLSLLKYLANNLKISVVTDWHERRSGGIPKRRLDEQPIPAL